MLVGLLIDGEMFHVYDKDVHAGYTVLARELEHRFPERTLRVTRQQVHMWSTRRDQNNFPQQYRVATLSGKIKNLYKIEEVVDWYRTYVPSRGGRTRTVAVDNSQPSE